MAISEPDSLASDFPLLDGEGWTKTSPADPSYNCIAWAAQDVRRWWWPGSPPVAYWPLDHMDEPTVATFETAFAQLGYAPCNTGELEEGFEKIAIYAKEGEVQHAARQLATGKWSSKIGQNIDLDHTLRGLQGLTYGEVVRFLKRPRTATAV